MKLHVDSEKRVVESHSVEPMSSRNHQTRRKFLLLLAAHLMLCMFRYLITESLNDTFIVPYLLSLTPMSCEHIRYFIWHKHAHGPTQQHLW